MIAEDLATILYEATDFAAYYASLGPMPVDPGSRLAFARAALHLDALAKAERAYRVALLALADRKPGEPLSVVYNAAKVAEAALVAAGGEP